MSAVKICPVRDCACAEVPIGLKCNGCVTSFAAIAGQGMQTICAGNPMPYQTEIVSTLRTWADACTENNFLTADLFRRAAFDIESLRTRVAEQDKLLAQALEALNNSVDLVDAQYLEAAAKYAAFPSRQPKVDGLRKLSEQHRAAITAIQEHQGEKG